MRKKAFFIGLLIFSVASMCSYGQDLEREWKRFRGYGFVDKSTGKVVIPHKYLDAEDFSEGLAAVRPSSKSRWGYIDKTGAIVIPYKYSYAEDFSEGLAAVCAYSNSRWGFIDKTGAIVIPYKYLGAKDFSEGLAAVRSKTDKWGFIDKTGIEVIAFNYSEVENFSEGFAPVRTGDFWGAIDKTGTVIVPHLYGSSKAVKNVLADTTKKESNVLKKESKETFSLFALNYVEQEMNKWAQKGEFERTADWQQRVNEDSRKAKKVELFNAAEQVYIAEQSKNMPVGNITLGAYNADIEVYLINNDLYGDWLAPVPIQEAPDFRDNWNNILKTPQWVISNDQLAFAGYKFLALEPDVTDNNIEQKENQTIQTAETKQSEQVIEEKQIVSNPVRTTATKTETVSNKTARVAIGASPVVSTGGDVTMYGFCGKFRVYVAKPVGLEGSFTYYLPKEINIWGVDYECNMWDANLNIQAKVNKSDIFSLYVLSGLGIVGIEAAALGEDGTQACLNTGGGFDVKLAKVFYFNTEVKIIYFFKNDGVHSWRSMASAGFVFKF